MTASIVPLRDYEREAGLALVDLNETIVAALGGAERAGRAAALAGRPEIATHLLILAADLGEAWQRWLTAPWTDIGG
jgi:hypothetical protein